MVRQFLINESAYSNFLKGYRYYYYYYYFGVDRPCSAASGTMRERERRILKNNAFCIVWFLAGALTQ